MQKDTKPQASSQWFNYDTQEYDSFANTPHDLMPYIEPGPRRNLYAIWRDHEGMDRIQAFLNAHSDIIVDSTEAEVT